MRLLILLLSVLFALPVAAQESALDKDLRELYILPDEDVPTDTQLLLRFPMELVYARAQAAHGVDAAPLIAPFLNSARASGQSEYRIDRAAFEEDFDGFVELLFSEYRFTVDGREVTPELWGLTLVDTAESSGPYRGLAETESLLSLCVGFPLETQLSDLLVVISAYLSDVGPADELRVQMLSPNPADQPVAGGYTEITDLRAKPPVVRRYPGYGQVDLSLRGDAPKYGQLLSAIFGTLLMLGLLFFGFRAAPKSGS